MMWLMNNILIFDFVNDIDMIDVTDEARGQGKKDFSLCRKDDDTESSVNIKL